MSEDYISLAVILDFPLWEDLLRLHGVFLELLLRLKHLHGALVAITSTPLDQVDNINVRIPDCLESMR
jgi:hypothetical protein